MTAIGRYRRDWAALATLALLLYALFAGFTDGAMASPQPGGVICSLHAGGSAPGAPGKTDDGHVKHGECCLAGCGFAGGKVLPAAVAPVSFVAARATAPEPVATAALVQRPERSPLNPRGPPSVV